MRANLWLSQFSFYLFCLFPLLILLQPKGYLAILFVLMQFLVMVAKKNTAITHGVWFPMMQTLPSAFLAVSLLYSDNLFVGGKYLETSILVFSLPWLLYANRSFITPEVQTKTLRFYAVIVAVFVTYLVGGFILSGEFTTALQAPNSYYHIRTYLEVESGMHPTYFSLLLAIALLGMQAEIKQGVEHRGFRIMTFACLSILLIGLLLASSKMILIATFLGSAFIWAEKWRLKTIFIRLTAAALLMAVVVLLIKPMRQRATDLFYAFAHEEVNQNNPDSMRKAIYKSTAEVISENFWFGTGIGDAQFALDEKYRKYGFSLAEERQFNTHNNYLNIWLAAGFIPFLFFVLLQISQLFIALANRNYLHFSMALLFSLSMLTENILSRQDGVFLYAFFSSFMVFASWSKSKNLIFINGRFKSQVTTGVQRFAEEISYYLLRKSTDYELIIPVKQAKKIPQNRSLPILKSMLWEQISLPVFLRLLGSPKLVNLGNSAPIFYSNQWVTLHDVAFKENPKWFSENFVRWYNFMVPKILKKSQHIFTVSEFSKSEIVKHFKIDSEKVTVVLNGMPRFAANAQNTEPIVPGNYALSVGTLSSRKNQKQIIESFLNWDDCPIKLVLAGAFDDAVFGKNKGLRDQIENTPHIILKEYPTDEELINLYQHARFTVYMPFYEGFGLPVLESLALKKPIIVSDIPVFRELFSGLVLFSLLDNIGNLRGQVEKMIQAPHYWAENVSENTDLEIRFSYPKSASALDEVIHQQKIQ